MAELARSQLQTQDSSHTEYSRGKLSSDSALEKHPFSNQSMQRILHSQMIQPKLKVSQPGDAYEQEADRVADQVLRMPDTGIQRMCSECEDEVQRQPIEEEEELQTKSISDQETQLTPDVQRQIDGLHGGGNPLSDSTRQFFEPRFGRDFSSVRVHTDSRAVDSARAIGARAYTRGTDVVFGAGEYNPETTGGRRLLAHELTHVTQQNQSTIQRQGGGGGPVAPPSFRDCNPTNTGIADSNERLEASRQRALEFIGAARRRLGAAPAAGSVYATALNRHFIAPNAGQRATIEDNFRQIIFSTRVNNYICNSQNICEGEQAFHLDDDDLIHVCRPFWDRTLTCRAIILIHEGAHDIGLGTGGHPPNRGDAEYPAGNVAPPGTETTAGRMNNPDAYAFFAAHIWRNTDTGSTCF